MEKICKNCEHFYGKSYSHLGTCYQAGRGILTWPDGSCTKWEKTTTPPISWKRFPKDFDEEEDCTIVVPDFYGNNSGELSGKVSGVTVYIYKAKTKEFIDLNAYMVATIPIEKMQNVWYVNLDEIGKPWKNQ